MEKIVDESKPKKKLEPYFLGVTFLLFEALAFLIFSLGNSILAYTIMGAILAALMTLLMIKAKKINSDGLLNAAFFIFPVVLFGIICAFSNFGTYEMDMMSRVCLPIALLSFSFIGYLSTLNKEINFKVLFTVLYATLAVITLINLITTWIQFMPFHSYFTKQYYIYFNGSKASVPVSRTAYGLMGFSLEIVKVEYVSLFPSLLLTSAVGLFFISPKKELKLFLVYIGFTLVSVLSLISITGLLLAATDFMILAVLLLIVLAAKGKLKEKVIRVILIALLVIAVIMFILVYLNGQTQWAFLNGYRSFIKSNRILNFVFNRVGKSYAAATQDIFGNHLLGHVFGNPEASPLVTPLSDFSNSWLFDLFVVGGLFGFILFIFALVIGFKGFYQYMKYSPKDNMEKAMIAAFILTYFIYTFLNASGSPYVFYDNKMPMYYTGPFFVVIFLLSYVYNASKKYEPVKIEETKKEEKSDEITL